MTDVRTTKQNRHLYWLFGKLGLKEAVPELVMQFTGNRTTHTSEMDFVECMNLIRYLEQFLRKPQEHPRRDSVADIDRHRKGVLKAIFEWGRLGGFEWDEEYVKGIACRAAGCDSFNDICNGDLVRIYNEFCRKQSVARAKAGSRKSRPTVKSKSQTVNKVMKRALTIKDIRDYKATTYRLDGGLGESLGEVELTGSWIIWGNSANGKTRFALQLAKALARHVKVAYDSLEEGLSLSMQKAIEDVGFSDVRRNFVLLDKESVGELRARLKRQRSAKVVIVDSLQYTGLTYSEYKALRDEFRSKLFVFVSHADGGRPKGAVANSVKYDAFVKIYVEGYKAHPQSRYGGGLDYTIWEEGARKFDGR